MDELDLAGVDTYYYDRQTMYQNDQYNRTGLFAWEKRALDRYFQNARRLVVGGVGGGREMLALEQLGFAVDGFECNPRLVEFANQLLANEGCAGRVALAPRNQCPAWAAQFDGAVIGWGSFMLIPTCEQRVAFLQQFRALVRDGGPILLSFFAYDEKDRHLPRVAKIANVVRRLRRAKPVEPGDDLTPNYVHHCHREEIRNALQAAGFEMVFFSDEEYGQAIGVASPVDRPEPAYELSGQAVSRETA